MALGLFFFINEPGDGSFLRIDDNAVAIFH